MMGDFRKQVDRITNEILKDIENVRDFNVWGNNIKDLLGFVDYCQKEVDNKTILIVANFQSALEEKNKLEAIAEEQFNNLCKFKQEHEIVEEERIAYFNEYEKQEQLCLDCEKQKEISSQDKELLFLTRKKYFICKEITNLVWDFNIPFNKIVAGFVINKKSKPYIKMFEYKKTQLSVAKIEKIWNEIEISSQEECTEIEKSKDNQKIM